jgi:hypothetical protein
VQYAHATGQLISNRALHWKDLPGKAALRVDDGVVASTVFTHHSIIKHLLPDVITMHGTSIVPVCTECDKALNNSRMPPHRSSA